MNKTIQIFEHEKLTLDKNDRGIQLTKPQLDKLYEFNDSNDNKYFTGIRDGVKFKEYVGVIQMGGQTIEILPKADKGNDYTKWRKVLLKMLAVCNKVNLETVSEADLSKKNYSILDLYFDRYLHEVNYLLHKGLVKRYRAISENVNALKGQLKFSKHLQLNLVHKERFYTKHQTYDFEHLVNQILLKALLILSKIITNPFLIDKVKTLLLNFPEIKGISIDKSHFDQIKLNRKSQDYKEALQIARMIILNYSPDINGGRENMIALLFNMNSLWEEYIYRMVVRNNKDKHEIMPQDSKLFWNSKTVRPDIVIKNIAQNETYIIDTKWKHIYNAQPSDDDLKQMYVYNEYWKASKGILLYPMVFETNDLSGKYHISSNSKSLCKIGFINIIKDGSLDMGIGEEIMNKFLKW